MRSRQEHGSVRAPDLWVQKKFTQSNRRKGKDGNRDISLSQGKDANAVRTYDWSKLDLGMLLVPYLEPAGANGQDCWTTK